MASGGLHKPVYDSANRPITAGGTVKTGPIIFMDIAKKAGLTIWHHTAGTPRSASFWMPKDRESRCWTMTTMDGSISIL